MPLVVAPAAGDPSPAAVVPAADRRPATRLFPKLCAGLIALLLAGSVAGAAAGPPGPAAGAAAAGPTAPDPPAPARVVVVAAAGLHWSDVSVVDTPTLAALTRTGSAGTLSVRSAEVVTCPAAGWLTLGAGGYAAVAGPGSAAPVAGATGTGVPGCEPPPPRPSDPELPVLPALRDLNGRLRFGARPGTLGQHLPCATAVGAGAALAVAGPAGQLRHYAPTLPAEPTELLERCPLTVVDLGTVGDPSATLQRFDRELARVTAALPPDTLLIVLGVAEPDVGSPARLHVAVAHGPGFGPGWLRSPSTQRVPYLQLVDVAPTVLAALGQPVPPQLTGRPWSGGAPGRPDDLAATLAALADTDRQAVAQRAAVGRFFAGLGVALLVVVASAGWLLYRAHRGRPGVARWCSVAALGLSAVPAATFLANLVPWWRTPVPLLALAAAVTTGALLMLALALLAGYRSRQWPDRTRVRLTVLAALTLVVFGLDTATGSQLQLNSLLGYNPLVAGRFIGFGNIAFAVYAGAGVLLATLVAHGHRGAAGWWRVAAVGIPVTIVDGMPWWGADFGGVLALVPTFAVLGLLLTRSRVTWGRLAAAIAAGVALVLAISVLDYLRPAADQSHFGRFLASLLDGSAGATVQRKLLTSLDLLLAGPHTLAAAALLLAGAGLLLRPPPALRRVYRTWPMVRTGLVGLLVLAGVGGLVNDSGIAIPTVMALTVLPTVVALCVWVRHGDPWYPAPR